MDSSLPRRGWHFFLLSLLGLMVAATSPVLAQGVIRLNVAPGGFPPYTVLTTGQQAGGIVVDVLRAVADKTGYSLQIMEIPRGRVDRMVLADELDASPRAMEWTEMPERFVFSDPLLRVRDVIFSNKSTPLAFNHPSDLENRKIGSRLGYTYPALETTFASGKVELTQVTNERALLAMLGFRRVDAVVINEMTALWVIKNEAWNDRFIYSRQEVQSYPYRLMFGKKWAHFVELFNRELSVMKKDGTLARIIQKYQPEMAVPQN